MFGSTGFDGSEIKTISAVAGNLDPTLSGTCFGRSPGCFKPPLGSAGVEVWHGGS